MGQPQSDFKSEQRNSIKDFWIDELLYFANFIQIEKQFKARVRFLIPKLTLKLTSSAVTAASNLNFQV